MKNIIKTARIFAKKVAIANQKIYLKFIELNNKIQILSSDIYEVDDKFLSLAQDMGRKVLLATDKIYRKGMSASEMQGVLSDLKSKLTNLMINPGNSKFIESKLSDVKSTLDSIIPMDIPAQDASKAKSQQSSPSTEGASKTSPVEIGAEPSDDSPVEAGVYTPSQKSVHKKTNQWSGVDPSSYILSEEDDEWDQATYPR